MVLTSRQIKNKEIKQDISQAKCIDKLTIFIEWKNSPDMAKSEPEFFQNPSQKVIQKYLMCKS